MKGIKNQLSVNLGKKKWYNPNRLNPLDGVIMMLITLGLGFVIKYALKPVFQYLYENVLNDYFLMECITTVICEAIWFFGAFIYLKIRRVTPFSGGGFSFKTNKIDLLMGVMLILGIYLSFSSAHIAVADYMENIFGDLGLTISEDVIENSNAIYILLYEFVIVPIVPAICEEIVFRGVIFRAFEDKGWFFASIMSAVLFSWYHGSVAMILLQFMGGLAMAVVSYLTKNHLIGIVMHFSHNLFCVLYAIVVAMATMVSDGMENLIEALLIGVGIVLFITSVYYFINKYLGQYKNKLLGKQKSKALPGDKKICFTTAAESEFYYREENFDYDDSEERNNKDVLFLYKDRFIPYNKKMKSNVLFYILLGISFVLILIRMFL